MKTLFCLKTSSASGVVGPLAPSATRLHPVADAFDGLGVDLAFQRAGDQHIRILGDPGIGVLDHIAGCYGLFPCRSSRTGR